MTRGNGGLRGSQVEGGRQAEGGNGAMTRGNGGLRMAGWKEVSRLSWCKQQDYARGPSCLQLEARKASRCVHHIHNGEPNAWEFGQPSLLVVVNMVSDSLVDGFVCPFTATIGFKVVGCGHL